MMMGILLVYEFSLISPIFCPQRLPLPRILNKNNSTPIFCSLELPHNIHSVKSESMKHKFEGQNQHVNAEGKTIGQKCRANYRASARANDKGKNCKLLFSLMMMPMLLLLVMMMMMMMMITMLTSLSIAATVRL